MEDFARRVVLARFIAGLCVWTVAAFFAFFKALEDGSPIAIGVVCFVGTFPFIALFFWLLDRKMKAAERKKGGLYGSSKSTGTAKKSRR